MRVLRSLLIGDCDHYFSPYIFGVQQGMSRLGHWHSQVSIRSGADVIAQRVRDVKPDILWTHMLLWAPPGSPRVEQLVEIALQAKKVGARVVIHDGDYKERVRYPSDISSWCALALCNHAFDRSPWKVPVMHWPYFAFAQEQIVDPSPHYAKLVNKLFFAGSVDGGNVYGDRTRLLNEVNERCQHLHVSAHDGNTLFRTAEIAASAQAVLGFGRPQTPGWIDTRVFQYPGAGAILIHDHAPHLQPWEHFAPYKSGDADTVVAAFEWVRALSAHDQTKMRHNAFRFTQKHHSSVTRVLQVLDHLFGREATYVADPR